jgi:hypothetical protein
MIVAVLIAIGGTLNFVGACLVLRASIRNCTMHGENLSMAEKIGKAMVMMKELRDMLDKDLHDPLTAGNARQKEVSH